MFRNNLLKGIKFPQIMTINMIQDLICLIFNGNVVYIFHSKLFGHMIFWETGSRTGYLICFYEKLDVNKKKNNKTIML